MSISHALSRSQNSARGPRAFPVLLLAALLVIGGCGASAPQAEQPGGASGPPVSSLALDALLPDALGEINNREPEQPGQPVVFVIGESHVNLDVQRAVAEILIYLRAGHGVTTIFTEGHDKPFVLPPLTTALTTRRSVAEAELLAREINGVEYVALSYPDVKVFGVGDLEAWKNHAALIEENQAQRRAWAEDFSRFVSEDLGQQRARAEDAARVSRALSEWLEDPAPERLQAFASVVADLFGRESPLARTVNELVKRDEALASALDFAADAPIMVRRDQAMVENSLARIGANKRAALVVGKLHLPGIERFLREAGAGFVSIVAAGVDEERPREELQEDYEVYQRWHAGTKTPFEEWLSENLKPPPATQRESYRKVLETFDALLDYDRQLRHGITIDTIIAAARRENLPLGLEVTPFPVDQGYGFEYIYGSLRAWAYFSNQPFTGEVPPGYIEIKSRGKASGRYYWFLAPSSRGGGQGPPIPPRAPPAGSPPDDPQRGRFQAAIEGQAEKIRREGRGDRTVVLWIEGERVILSAGGIPTPLNQTADEFRNLRRRLEDTEPGPEKIRLGNQLAAILLPVLVESLAEDGPIGELPGALYVADDGDLLGGYRLRFLASLARDSSAELLRGFTAEYHVDASLTDLAEKLVAPETPADIPSTVIWVTDAVADSEAFREMQETLEAKGARVNVLPERGATLLLVGTGEIAEGISLRDGRRLTAASAELANALESAGSVLTLGYRLEPALEKSVERLLQLQTQPETVATTLGKIIDSIAEHTGQGSLASAIGQVADKDLARVNEMFASEAALADIDAVSDVMLAERAMQV